MKDRECGEGSSLIPGRLRNCPTNFRGGMTSGAIQNSTSSLCEQGGQECPHGEEDCCSRSRGQRGGGGRGAGEVGREVGQIVYFCLEMNMLFQEIGRSE